MAHRENRTFQTEPDVKRLFAAAKKGRCAERDHLHVLRAYQPGLRTSDLMDIRMSDLGFETGWLFVRRLIGSVFSNQPRTGDYLHTIRSWLCKRGETKLRFLLIGQREPLIQWAVATFVRMMDERPDLEAEVHLHILHKLRHSTSDSLANRGYGTRLIQDWLEHKNIVHTVRYTKTAATQFGGL